MSDNPFDDLEPKDGFRVLPHDLGDLEISLHVGLKIEGTFQPAFDRTGDDAFAEVWKQRMPETADHGRRARARLLMDAVCRYFNAGGDWGELEDMLNRSRDVMRNGLTVPGWHYFDGYVDTEGNFTHLFVADDGSGRVVRWVEGQYVDTGLTLEMLMEEMEQEDEEEAAARQSRVHHLLQLPNQQDSQGPEEVEGDAETPRGEGPGEG